MGGIYSLSSCQGRGQRLIDIIILFLKPLLLLLLKICIFNFSVLEGKIPIYYNINYFFYIITEPFLNPLTPLIMTNVTNLHSCHSQTYLDWCRDSVFPEEHFVQTLTMINFTGGSSDEGFRVQQRQEFISRPVVRSMIIYRMTKKIC